MFNNKESEMYEKARKDLIIVCDESTITFAKDLSNDIADKYTCCVWNAQQYRDNEPKLSNKNKVLFLDSELKEENLGRVEEKIILGDMTYLKVHGNQLGMFGEISLDNYFDNKRSKSKILRFLGKLLGEDDEYYYNTVSRSLKIMKEFDRREKKKLKPYNLNTYFKIVFDDFKDKYLDDFMNGKLH